MPSLLVRAALVASIVALPGLASAIPLMPDTFEDGTTMGWFVPGVSPFPPVNIADGGPAGAGDAYLELTATGDSGLPGGRLSVLNDSQWTGNYAGLTAITMDVNNFGPSDVVLRLLLEHFPMPGPPTDLAVTLADVTVPAGSGWTSVTFDLTAANLDAIIGTVGAARSGVGVLRLFHNPVATHPGPPIGPPAVNVVLGVDNITAVVPEPVTSVLLAGGIGAYLVRRRVLRSGT